MSKHVWYDFPLSSATSSHARWLMRGVRVLDEQENAAGITGKRSAGVSSYELLENIAKRLSQELLRARLAEVTSQKFLGKHSERFGPGVTGSRLPIVSSQE